MHTAKLLLVIIYEYDRKQKSKNHYFRYLSFFIRPSEVIFSKELNNIFPKG